MALPDWFSEAVMALANAEPYSDPCGGYLKVIEMVHFYNFFI
jgi:hypothetical protein